MKKTFPIASVRFAVWRPALLVFLACASVSAAPEETAEDKLRGALRDTMLKLRDAQGQIATAQAAQIAAEDKIKELTAKSEALTKDLMAERNTSANMIAGLNAKIEERDKSIVGLQATVQKWKKSYSEVTAFAAKKETERAKQEAKALQLEREVASQKVKNLEMFKAGMDTLDRYEKFGLGDALLAREPFVGTTKVKFQTLIQDQADKLADARIDAKPADSKPEDPKATDSTAKPADANAKAQASPSPAAKPKA